MEAFEELIGDSPVVLALKQQLRGLLERQGNLRRLPPILIHGETGTGKGLLARAIHRAGHRAGGPFVDINCAAIPETLLEAELFGYERGAFTDARQAKPGLFQAANGGMLFLDEIGLLPRGLQAKLLAVLEQQTVRRLGSTRSETVDVGIIAATNEDLTAAVRDGRFREDLYHRLAVLTLEMPPLRRRDRDVELLAEHVLARVCADYGLSARMLSTDAHVALRAYAWPGNVRELNNVIERAALLTDNRTITAACLALPGGVVAELAVGPEPEPPSADVAPLDRLVTALNETGWNITRTASRLGITRNTVRSWIRRYGLRFDSAPDATYDPAGNAIATDESAGQRGGARVAVEASVRWSERRVMFLRVRAVAGVDASAATTRLLDRIVDKVQSFGGRVDEVSRTGLLATFGTEAAEDAPRRSVNAALAIRHATEHDHHTDDVPPPPAVGITLHAGRVMVALLAGRTEIDQDDLNAARRALDALEPLIASTILATDTAAGLLERHIDMRRRGTGEGAGQVVVAHLARDATEAPFVGRVREIETLTGLLDRALDGRGQVVSIVGEPGIGKSRLVQEFRQSIAPGVAVVLEGRCVAHAVNVPFFPLLEILQSACSDEDVPTADAAAAVVHARFGPSAGDRASYIEALLDPRKTAALAGQSPQAIKGRTFEAIQQLLLAVPGRAALVVVVEDLHWIDRTSEELLSALTEVIVGARVVLVTTSRPGYRPPWSGRSHVTQLALPALSELESRRLVVSVMTDIDRPGAVVGNIVARAEGNPFFLEELARSVRAGHGSARAALPITIRDVVAARIDGLPDTDRHLLRLGAVIGRDVPLRLVVEASALSVDDVRGCVRRLQALEFLYPARLEPEPEYTFRHALMQEVAYDGIPVEDRAAMHARVARAIEVLDPEAAERHPEVLGRHYAAAGRPHEAIVHLRRAGELAVRRSANAEAIAHLAQAIGMLESIPPDAGHAQDEIGLQLPLASALAGQGGFGSVELEATLARLRALTAQAGLTPNLIPVRFSLWRFALSRADFDTAEPLVAELLATDDRLLDASLRVGVHTAAGTMAFYRGDLPRARRHYERIAEHHDAAGDLSGALRYGQDLGLASLGYLGWTFTLMGQPDRGAAMAEQALAVSRRGGHPFTIAHALNVAGLVRCDRREPGLVARHGEEMLVLSREQGFTFLTALALMLVGWSRLAEGDVEGGLSVVRDANASYRSVHQRVGLRPRAQLAEAFLAAGDADSALATADEALAHAGATRDELYRSEVLRIKGETLARRSADAALAEVCLRDAIQAATAQGARLLVLRAATSLLRLQRASGRPAPVDNLRGVYEGFREGLDLADLRAARELLSAGR